MIQFRCPKCGATLRLADGLGGQRGRCPGCSTVVDVPRGGPPPLPTTFAPLPPPPPPPMPPPRMPEGTAVAAAGEQRPGRRRLGVLIAAILTVGVFVGVAALTAWRILSPSTPQSAATAPRNVAVVGALPPAALVYGQSPGEWKRLASSPPPPPSTRPTIVESAIELPGPIDDAIPGGAGRYLLLPSKASGTVSIFDADTRTIVKTITPTVKDFTCAAGLDKFFMAGSRPATIERWDFATLQPEQSTTFPKLDFIGAAAIGSGVTGPMLVIAGSNSRAPHGFLFDPEAMAEVAGVTWEDLRWPNDRSESHNRWGNGPDVPAALRAVADGSVFTMTQPNSSAGGVFLLTVQGKVLVDRYTHDDTGGYVTATEDGNWLLSARAVYSRAMRPVANDPSLAGWLHKDARLESGRPFQSVRFLPAGRGGLMIEARNGPPPQSTAPGVAAATPSPGGPRSNAPPLPPIIEHLPDGRVIVRTRLPDQPIPPGTRNNPTLLTGPNGPSSTLRMFLVRDWTGASPIAEFPTTPELTYAETWADKGLAFDRRVHWLPDHRLFVTIPPGNGKLVLRPFELKSAPPPPKTDSMVITTAPPLVARRGQTWTYQPDFAFVQPGRFAEGRVDFGPAGIDIGPDGRLTWSVPAGFPQDRVSVVLNLRDAPGREFSHAFVLHVH